MNYQILELRIENFDEIDNEVLLSLETDLLEEKRNRAQIKVVAYQLASTWYYNSKVKTWRFYKGDLFLRLIFLNTKEAFIRPSTYELETLDNQLLMNP